MTPQRLTALLAVLYVMASFAPPLGADEGIAFFERKIRPLLIEKCYECHSEQADEPGGGLLLDRKSGWEEGGDRGPAIVPGNPDKSRLIEAVRYTNPDLQMPPKGPKLTEAQVADLVAWVKMGAPDPRVATAEQKAWVDPSKKHWAFQPVKKPAVPAVKDTSWAKTDIDKFIVAKLEEKGMKPNPPADCRVLARRLSLDLIGLPPTSEEVESLCREPSEAAWGEFVERLLASPHFGEHWAAMWLDLARYADTRGYEKDRSRTMWPYRDWVIGAFNRDLPYDQFTREQLAGDSDTNKEIYLLRRLGADGVEDDSRRVGMEDQAGQQQGPTGDDPHVQPGDGEQMRDPGVREDPAPPGIEIVPASEHQGVHQRRASPVQALDPPPQRIANPVPDVAPATEQAHVLHPEHARRPESAHDDRSGTGHQRSGPGHEAQLTGAALRGGHHRGARQPARDQRAALSLRHGLEPISAPACPRMGAAKLRDAPRRVLSGRFAADSGAVPALRVARRERVRRNTSG